MQIDLNPIETDTVLRLLVREYQTCGSILNKLAPPPPPPAKPVETPDTNKDVDKQKTK